MDPDTSGAKLFELRFYSSLKAKTQVKYIRIQYNYQARIKPDIVPILSLEPGPKSPAVLATLMHVRAPFYTQCRPGLWFLTALPKVAVKSRILCYTIVWKK